MRPGWFVSPRAPAGMPEASERIPRRLPCQMLAEAATFGRFPGRAQIEASTSAGPPRVRAGRLGWSRGRPLSVGGSTRVARTPRDHPKRDNKAVRAAATAVLQVVDDATSSFAEGHAEAGREMVRREETLRRELVEDLLRGDAHLSELVGRAEPFGLDLTRAHQVALAQPNSDFPRSPPPRLRLNGSCWIDSAIVTSWWQRKKAWSWSWPRRTRPGHRGLQMA